MGIAHQHDRTIIDIVVEEAQQRAGVGLFRRLGGGGLGETIAQALLCLRQLPLVAAGAGNDLETGDARQQVEVGTVDDGLLLLPQAAAAVGAAVAGDTALGEVTGVVAAPQQHVFEGVAALDDLRLAGLTPRRHGPRQFPIIVEAAGAAKQVDGIVVVDAADFLDDGSETPAGIDQGAVDVEGQQDTGHGARSITDDVFDLLWLAPQK